MTTENNKTAHSEKGLRATAKMSFMLSSGLNNLQASIILIIFSSWAGQIEENFSLNASTLTAIMVTNCKYKYSVFTLLFFCIISLASCSDKTKNDSSDVFIFHDTKEITNENAKKWFEKGLWYVEHNEYEYAKRCFIKADMIYPNSPIILNAIGDALLNTNGDSTSIDYYKKSLNLDSNFIPTYTNYGAYLNAKRQYVDAKTILYLGLTKCVTKKVSANKGLLMLNLAYSYDGLGDFKNSYAFLDSAQEAAPNEKIYNAIQIAKARINKENLIKK